MTNAIGSGTCNLPVNVTVEERNLLGRLAFRCDLSTGEFLRRMIRRGVALSDPEAAKKLARIRRERMNQCRAAAMLLLFGAWLVIGSDTSVRRPARTARVPRVSAQRRTEI